MPTLEHFLTWTGNAYTTQIQNFSIIIKNLENRKNKYEKIIQIIFIEYYNEILLFEKVIRVKVCYLLKMQFKILA